MGQPRQRHRRPPRRRVLSDESSPGDALAIGPDLEQVREWAPAELTGLGAEAAAPTARPQPLDI